jgi:transcriptional regulator with XRE-family HTH domain
MSTNISTLVTAGTARYDVAAAIRAHLAVRRMSDSALGRAIGMSQSKISRRTNGEIAFDTDDLGRIASHLGITVVELIQMPTTAEDSPRPGAGAGPRSVYLLDGQPDGLRIKSPMLYRLS